MREERFYIPIKLNRTIMLAYYSIADVAILTFLLLPTVVVLVATGSVLTLLPLLTYGILRMRFGERTIGEKLHKIIKHLGKPQIYLLKECIRPNENH